MNTASVIVTCFNAVPYIRPAIESALAQTHPRYEVVVIDDGSTDGSDDVIKEFEGRIKWESGPNQGANHARNRGLELARGAYCQFLDGDDLLDADKLAKQVAFLETHPEIDLVVGVARIWRLGDQGEGPQELWGPPAEGDVIREWLRCTVAQTNTMLWRTDFLRSIGGWNEKFPSHQDNEVVLRAIMAGGRLAIDPVPRSTWRQWSVDSLSSDPRSRSSQTWLQLTEAFNSWVQSQPDLKQRYAADMEESVWSKIRLLAEASPKTAIDVIRVAERDGRLGINHWRWGGAYGRSARMFGFTFANALRRWADWAFGAGEYAKRWLELSDKHARYGYQRSAQPQSHPQPTTSRTLDLSSPTHGVKALLVRNSSDIANISVVIPVHNRAAMLRQTLRSLFGQTLLADEIIVVDDGSSDGTAEAAESEFHRWKSERVKSKTWEGGKLPEFKVIRQENAGPGAARNRGFAASRGEFIHFFDSDDIAAPNKHEVQMHALQETRADIAFGPWVKGYIREQGAWRGELGASTHEGEYGAGRNRYSFEPEGRVLQQRGLPKAELIRELLTRWSVVVQACLFRRSIIEESGGFPDDMFVAEDQIFFLRCLLAGARVVHTPQTLAFYRLGDAGKLTESADGHRRRIADWALFLERSRKECASHGILPDKWFDFQMRLWSAQRERAALLGLNESSSAAVSDCGFGAVARLRKLWGGVKVRLTGNRQNSSFRCGRMTQAQAALFPTS